MKRILRPIGIGVGLGLFLVLIQHMFDIDQHLLLTLLFLTGAVIILGTLLFNLLYIRPFRKKVYQQIALLEEGRADECLTQMESMLKEAQKKKLKQIAQLCRLNMTAAYCDLKQYDKAMEILEELSQEKFSDAGQLVFRLNLCACYFYLGQQEQALLTYQKSSKLFDLYRKSKTYGGNIAVVTMRTQIAQGQYDQAAELLAYARTHWNRPRLVEDYQQIEELLHSAANKPEHPPL